MVTPRRASPAECVGLVLLPLAPPGLLAFLASLRNENSDLSGPFQLGSSVFFLAGACLAVLGAGGRRWSGVTTLVSVLMSVVLGWSTVMYWVGSHEAVVTVLVRDAETGLPLPDASVRLDASERGGEVAAGRTDRVGRAELPHEFSSSGYSSLIKRRGSFYCWREVLCVDAEGYEPLREPLHKHLGLGRPLDERPLPAVEVSLKRKP